MPKRNDGLREHIRANPPPKDDSGWLTYRAEVAKKFGVSPDTVTRAAGRPAIPVVAAAPRMPITEQVTRDRRELALRGELELLRKKYANAQKDANAQEVIIEMAKLALNALPPVETLPPMELSGKPDVESAVLVGSCWHIGEVVRKEEMGGLNEYNFDVFRRRLQFLVEKTISFTALNMRAHQFDELRVLLTGDMVSGIIHDELAETNQLNIIEQATLGALVTAQAIQDLARHFPSVIVTCVIGNHGRIKKEKYFKNKWVNWDTVFYNYLALLLREQPNVTFQIPQSFWCGVDIKGWKFLVTHGDLIKSWGSIPFYGIKRAVDSWMEVEAARGKTFQYFVASHFHNMAVLQKATGESILNASLKGGDEYALGIGRYSDPVQMLFGVHHKYGKTWSVSINTKYATGNSRYAASSHLTLPEQLDTLGSPKDG